MVNLETTLRVGNEVRFKSGEAGFITVICEIINKNIIKILLPANIKEPIAVFRGERYNVVCVNEKAMYMLETMVKDVYVFHEVIAIELEALCNTKIQRRDAFRVNENISVRVCKIPHEADSEEKWLTTKTVDISETGMQIKLNEPCPVGQLLELSIHIDTLGIRKTLTDIKGKVVRCINKPRGSYLGIKFENMPKKAKDTIIKLAVLSQRNKLSYKNYKR